MPAAAPMFENGVEHENPAKPATECGFSCRNWSPTPVLPTHSKYIHACVSPHHHTNNAQGASKRSASYTQQIYNECLTHTVSSHTQHTHYKHPTCTHQLYHWHTHKKHNQLFIPQRCTKYTQYTPTPYPQYTCTHTYLIIPYINTHACLKHRVHIQTNAPTL